MAGREPITIYLGDLGTLPNAGEKRLKFVGEKIEVRDFKGGVTTLERPNEALEYEFTPRSPEGATVTAVRRVGLHDHSLKWRLATGGDQLIRPGTRQGIGISTRLRLSLWTFVPLFVKDEKKMTLKDDEVAAVLKSGIDDLTFVHTLTWNPQDDKRPVLVDAKFGAAYYPEVVKRLRPSVQVVIGFALGGTSSEARLRARSFIHWLENASDGTIASYAGVIVSFFGDLAFDGVGFNLECDGLTTRHTAKLKTLIQKTTEAMRARKGFVAYGTAPFGASGNEGTPPLNAQPYSIAEGTPNLLARAMTFSGTDQVAFSLLTTRLASTVGTKIHPSHLQYSSLLTKNRTEALKDFCQDVLRPNRVGLVLALGASGTLVGLLADCAAVNARLNPFEAPRSSPGQPLQVPNAEKR